MDRAMKWFSATLLILAVATWAGCGPEKKAANGKPGEKPDEHAGHNHEAHDDHPMHGPNGGHIAELDCEGKAGVEDYHGEWLSDDESGTVTVILLGKDVKTEVGTSAEELSLDVKTGDEVKTHTLKPVNRTDGDKPTATRFEAVDQPLVTYLSNDVLDAVIRVVIDGKEFKGKLVQHKH